MTGKQYLSLAIFILILAALAMGAFWLRDNTVPESEQMPVVNNEDEVSEWKTHRNDQHGYEFDYPESWFIGRVSDVFHLSDNKDYINFQLDSTKTFPSEDYIGGSTFASENIVPPNTPLKEALKLEEGRGTLPLIKEDYLTINRINAYRALRELKKGDLLWDNSPHEGKRITNVEYSFIQGNDLYRIWFAIIDDSPGERIALADKIAQTFRTADKKTDCPVAYSNSEYGFSFNCPKGYSVIELGSDRSSWPNAIILIQCNPQLCQSYEMGSGDMG